jgi:hypothetical protein
MASMLLPSKRVRSTAGQPSGGPLDVLMRCDGRCDHHLEGRASVLTDGLATVTGQIRL